MSITISKSSALSISVILIFKMLKSYRSDLSIEVLNLIGLLGLLFSALPEWS